MKIVAGVIYILFFVSWGANLVKLTECDFESPYKCEVIRGIGVAPLAPVGVITGFMNFEFDGK